MPNSKNHVTSSFKQNPVDKSMISKSFDKRALGAIKSSRSNDHRLSKTHGLNSPDSAKPSNKDSTSN